MTDSIKVPKPSRHLTQVSQELGLGTLAPGPCPPAPCPLDTSCPQLFHKPLFLPHAQLGGISGALPATQPREG